METTLSFSAAEYRGFRAPQARSEYRPPPGQTLSNTQVRVTVHDARLLDPPPTLESHGFQLVHWPTELDLLDNDCIAPLYYEECRQLIRSIAGPDCHRVVGGSHQYRNGGRWPSPSGSVTGYASGIHSDASAYREWAESSQVAQGGNSEGSGPGGAREMGGMGTGARHTQSLNVWRSVDRENPVEEMLLCVCDMRSVLPEDVVFNDGQNGGNTHRVTKIIAQGLAHHPDQRWYYFSRMTNDEALVFRQYYTLAEPLNLRTVFHTAAVDPSSPPDAAPRYSIEVRMSALYGFEDNKPARVERWVAEIPTTYPDGSESTWGIPDSGPTGQQSPVLLGKEPPWESEKAARSELAAWRRTQVAQLPRL